MAAARRHDSPGQAARYIEGQRRVYAGHANSKFAQAAQVVYGKFGDGWRRIDSTGACAVAFHPVVLVKNEIANAQNCLTTRTQLFAGLQYHEQPKDARTKWANFNELLERISK